MDLLRRTFRDWALTRAPGRVHSRQGDGLAHSPTRDRVSVGVVVDGNISRVTAKDPRAIFEREISRTSGSRPGWQPGDASGILADRGIHVPVTVFRGGWSRARRDDGGFRSGVFERPGCWHSRVVAAADAAEGGVSGRGFSAAFTEYSRLMHEGIENMRKLIYAFMILRSVSGRSRMRSPISPGISPIACRAT